jgi:hypothetical protein
MQVASRARTYLAVLTIVGIVASSSVFASEKELQSKDILGPWYGLKTVPGMGISTMRRAEFFADGTYVTHNPETRGTYRIEGNTLTLQNLWTFKYKNRTLTDSMGGLVPGNPTTR